MAESAVAEDVQVEAPPSPETVALDRLAEQLGQSFPDVPADEVALAIRTEHARYDRSPIRDFVPILIERAARRRLTERTGQPAPTV
jgi:hypothetical protein